jgi:eukaryotic-like serine/threonine-protein kinase
MKPEQWQQAREVLADALELKPEDRPAFLDRACSSDHALRREVERLIAASDEARSDFLQSPAVRVTLLPGTKLGAYEVKALVGAGGMGEVYRARDTRLQRDVAIKVLPSLYAGDSDRLRRFEQEARAAAALNHPNILAVHQLGTYEGAPYLVSELLEGGTLRQQLVRGPMPFRKAVDAAVQVARGLAAAHEKGIVHRDLKPENLFLTKDGRIKILDFGLAKLVQSSLLYGQSEATASITEAGIVMGTVGYMAPEQVSGQTADHRTDIFAFGSVFYEMLSGKRAFQKPTSAETMSAILNEDPPGLSQITPNLAPALQRVVHRCLEKNPEQRFQSASDLAFALEPLSDSGALTASSPIHSRNVFQHWVLWIIGITFLISAVLGIFWLRSRNSVVPATEWVQITNLADSVTSPAFSPDGRMLTFLRGNETFVSSGQVYIMLLPHGNPVQLTNDSSEKMSPVFSLDGSSIDYTVPWDTWTVPVLGGQPRRRLPNASGLTWLDSEKVIFSQIISGSQMGVVSSGLSRFNVQPVYTPESSVGMAHRSYLSPDRKWVIIVEMTGNFWDRCRLVPFDGANRGTQIGPADGICTAAAWSPDGKWMYLNSNSGGAFHIWRQQFPSGRIEQITSGPTEEEGIAIAPDGKAFVTAVGMRRSAVWLHDSHGDRMLTSEARAALADSRNGSPFSADGQKLYYIVRRSPGREVMSDRAVGELWELDLRSGTTQPTLPDISISDFSLSPDGQQIAFTQLTEDGRLSIWMAPLDRSSSPRLLQSSAEHPRFTPDFIYYIKRSLNRGYAHRIRPDGSGDQQIWDENILTLATSPDGRYLAVTLPIEKGGQWKLEIVDWAHKKVHPVCKDGIVYWSDDGRSLYVFASFGKANRTAPAYLIRLSAGRGIPELPAAGFSDVAQLVASENAHVIAAHAVAAGRTPDAYAYVKENFQRDLYRIPLH